ncbi:MAG: CheR family methyltransferase [Candidatus Saccharibacteria bacterium]
MSAGLSSQEFALMQKYIEDKCGITLGEDKAYLIETRLSKLLIDSGLNSFEELYHHIRTSNDQRLVEKVIDAITTHETLWFRDRSPWEIMGEVMLPEYVKMLREGRRFKIRIWSAACSTGQEPYSVAMLIDNYLNRNGISDVRLSQFEIVATDISTTVLDIARLGRYDSISIQRGLGPEYRDKYFANEGRIWLLDDKIKNAVTFKPFNLQADFGAIGRFDLVLCRYVLIYFSEQLRKSVVNKISRVLENDGVLLIGSSEIFNDFSENYESRRFNEGTFYQVKR